MHALLLTLALLPAHPVPKDNHDRTVVVRLTPEAVIVKYRLEMDEVTATREMVPPAELSRIFSTKELHAAIGRHLAEAIAGNLVVNLDDASLEMRCTRRSEHFTDHLRCEYHFEAAWNPTPGKVHRFEFLESNWDRDETSKLALYLTTDGRLSLQADVPSEELIARPSIDRKPGDNQRRREAKATFRLEQVESRALYKPALPPDPVLPALPEHPEDGATAKAGEGITPAEAKVQGPTATESPEESSDADLPSAKNLLALMLDSRLGLGMVLLLATLFGAVHALTPGHGKTLVAAYLVGERGTIWHALLLGLVTTLTHTSVVIVMAIILWFQSQEAAAATQQALVVVGGLLLAGLGFWLLLRRVTGQADHVHIGGGHHHHHGPGHDHDHVHVPIPTDGQNVSWWGMVVLGVYGGIVPCWDAIYVLGLAISAQRLWLGLPLVLAFSFGLAAVLVGLGIGVVYGRNLAEKQWGSSRGFERMAQILPRVTAVLMIVMGMWLSYAGIHSPPGH